MFIENVMKQHQDQDFIKIDDVDHQLIDKMKMNKELSVGRQRIINSIKASPAIKNSTIGNGHSSSDVVED